MNKLKYIGIVGLFFWLSSPASVCNSTEVEPLKIVAWGSKLPPVTVDIKQASLNLQIDLGKDIPLETFVTAHTPAGNVLQRTNLGYWIPWSGRINDLVNNFSTQHGKQIHFKILKDENLSKELFPIRIMVAYKTAAEFKFGVFELQGRRSQ